MNPLIFATASATNLYPIPQGVSKQLLTIYDKPMVNDPISALMRAGESQIKHER